MSSITRFVSKNIQTHDMEHEPRSYIGIIVGYGKPPTHLSFSFQVRDQMSVSVGDLVEVPVGSYVIVGRITRIVSKKIRI